MTLIRLVERSRKPDGSFTGQVAVGDGGEYEFCLVDPSPDGAEAELAWYFQEHLRYPFLDRDREQAAEQQIAAYGRDLFGQVLGGQAHADYRQLRSRAFDDCRLEVVGSTEFHRLHWEALRDPDLPDPLAVRIPITRRVDRLASQFTLPAERETLNLMVVTARPNGSRDVGYRTISRPLLNGLRQARLPIEVDLARPGTWTALKSTLAAATQAHGSGWYQVLHFDLHGAVGDYLTLDAERAAGRMTFPAGRWEPYGGDRGFLFFETGRDGVSAAVPAAAVAALLAQHRVPMVVLNACQSAMQVGSEASLAQHLVQAGVPVAVGMAFSVTVTAAAQAVPVLYSRLADGADPVLAVHDARRSLFDHRGRDGYFNQQLDLEDWLLPVLFRQQPLDLRLREMTRAESTGFYGRQALVGDEPHTEYGFVGRDLDIQSIERRVLHDAARNQLLIQGMAGAGKSTLLTHLGWWWQRTGLVKRVFRFSYEERAWTAGQIIRQVSSTLLDNVEQAKLEGLPDRAQLERIAQLLRADRYLLILDNCESITANYAAIPHALDPGQRDQLKILLSRLGGGRTLVLLGSRELEAWLAAGTFDDNAYSLPGLDPQAASVLVDRILSRHRASRHMTVPTERAALDDVVTLLGGYPLPMTVVLPTLKDISPSVVLADLRAGGGTADPVGTITRAIEYSHGKLDPAAQASLLMLAPFTAAIPTGQALEHYHDLLIDGDSVRKLGPLDLSAALQHAVQVGLAGPHPEMVNTVEVQPVLPYFLRTRLRDRAELITETSAAHYQFFSELALAIHTLLLGRPAGERARGQAAARAHYANLTGALQHALSTSRPIRPLIYALEEYLDQTHQQPARLQLLQDTLAALSAPASNEQRRTLGLLHNLAGIVTQTLRRFNEAQTHFQEALALAKHLTDQRNVGRIYHQLGMLARLQGRLGEAAELYRRALDIDLEFDDRHSAAGTYHELGTAAQLQGRLSEAAELYRRALDIKLEFDDRHSAAGTYHQLGTVAQLQGHLSEAEELYRRALDINLEFDDRHSAASSYHQLGMVARLQGRLGEADELYRRALDINLEFDDRSSTASSYHELGTVARLQGRLSEADELYRRALDINLEFDDRHSAASSYHELGTVARLQGRLREADELYRRALDIDLEFDDRQSAAGTYHQLGTVAQLQGHLSEADELYRQALDIFLKLDDQRQASASATARGQVLLHLGKSTDGLKALIYGALLWRQALEQWHGEDIRLLRAHRHEVDAARFAEFVAAICPPELQAELTHRINDSDPD